MSAADYRNKISETSFQRQVVELAERCSWWVWHDNDSRRNKAGLPDLIMIRPPRVVFVELKAQKGRFRPAQKMVLELLSRCPGVEVYSWRPSDWDTLKPVVMQRVRPDACEPS